MVEIDFDRIRQRSIRDFMSCRGLLTTRDFIKMQPTCFDPDCADEYRSHQETYLIEASPEVAWNAYKTIHPSEAWCGHMISFGLQYSRATGAISYIDDHYHGMEVGTVLVLSLKLLWGLFHLAVAHELMEINDEQRSLKLCYMASGASEGSQWISLKETPEGHTLVVHETLYKQTHF